MMGPPVLGIVAAGFEDVREQFEALAQAEGPDLDAQVAAYHRGELVVDLWTGPQSAQDTLLGIYSASKGVTHLLVALLVQERVLDLEQRVSHYWPEFAVADKREIRLRELLSHQAGLIGTPTGFSIDELADDQLVAQRLAGQRPWWRPGSASGYHALVMAALSGEVVRRATGETVQELFASRLRDRYGLDLHIGLAAADDHRYLPAQPMIETPERVLAMAEIATAPDSLSGIAFNRHHPQNRAVWELPNHVAVRSLGTASFGGVSTARALAKLYSLSTLATEGFDPFLNSDTAATFAQIQSSRQDLVLRQHKAWAVGFHASGEQYPILSASSFGHSGAGGQQSLVDPRNQLSYAFLRRRFCYPPQADADHTRMLAALLGAARAHR